MKTSLFKNKNFVLLYFGRLVSNFGHVFYNFAIGWYILDLTNSSGAAGTYMAFGALVYFIFAPFAGVLSDRWNRLKIVYITDFVRGAVIAISGLIIMQNSIINLPFNITIDFANQTFKLVVLYITSFIFSINGALFSPAITSLTPYIVKKEELHQVNASFNAQNAVINIAGTITAAAVYAWIGIGWIFVINGIAYIGSAISEIFIKVNAKEENSAPLTVKTMFKEMGEGFKYLFSSKGLAVIALVAIILNFASAPIYSIGLPYLFNQILQKEPLFYSLVGIAVSVGSIIMSVIFTVTKSKDKIYPYMRGGLLSWIPLMASQVVLIYLILTSKISFTLFFVLFVITSLLDGFISVYVNTPIGVAFQKYVPKEMLGRFSSILTTIMNGLSPIAIAFGGWFLEYRPLTELYLFALVAFIIGSLIFIPNKNAKQL